MSRSILQNKADGECLLCRILGPEEGCWPLEEHHVMFGRRFRKKSEHYGLKVYIGVAHHRIGENAVHQNEEVNDILKQLAQIQFEKKYSHELWMKEFGINYLDEEIRERYLEEDESC